MSRPRRTVARGLAVVLLALGMNTADARAYSYAAAGAEPLIDAREATLEALEANDLEAARKASSGAQAELEYLDTQLGTQLRAALDAALASRDAERVDRVYLEGFAAEVRRRIVAARESLSDYQRAKVLVVKSKRFVDLLAPHLAVAPRASAQKALEACLEAIGNPGVFGVGAAAANPEAFAEASADLIRSLETL